MVKDTRSFPLAFWLLLVSLPAGFFFAMYYVDGTRAVDNRWVVRLGEAVVLDQGSPPAESAAWQAIKLPASIRGGQHSRTSVWWRLEVPHAPGHTDPEWIVAIPFPDRGNFALWINDRFVAEKGRLESPVGMLRRPVGFAVPAGLLDRSVNELQMRVVRGSLSARLAVVIVGPRSEVGGYVDYMYRVLATLPSTLAPMMLLLALIMGAVHLRRSKTTTLYGWYALTLAVWALHIFQSQNESPPVGNTAFWTTAALVTLGAFVAVAALFVNRFVGVRHPVRERLILCWAGAGAGILSLLQWFDGPGGYFVAWVWIPSLLLVGGYTVFQLFRETRRQPDWDRLALLLVAVFIFTVGVRDYLYNDLGLLPGNIVYLRFAAGIALIVFALILIRRFIAALDAAESVNEMLETRVREKTRELEIQHERTRALDRRQVLVGERQRLLREMHDGLGGHIVHALATAESHDAMSAMVPSLNLALEDLRLIIDSLDSSESTFDAVFVSLRQRCATTAESVGLELVWEIQDHPRLMSLNAHQVLNLARIVQEAVTNVLKHASANRLEVRGRVDDQDRLHLVVTDDGDGIPDQAANGRGLTSMQARASELGAQLTVEAKHPGSCVSVVLAA